MIDNQTDHYEYISGLTDNMASEEPYIVDFSCNDGSVTITTSTYFWINTSELDKYFLYSTDECIDNNLKKGFLMLVALAMQWH